MEIHESSNFLDCLLLQLVGYVICTIPLKFSKGSQA